MSSTMITSYMDFNETLHKDFTMPTISARNCIDIKIFPRGVVAADKLDLPSAFRPANGNNSSSDRHAIARRHSSSVYSAASFAASTTPTLAASFAYPPSSAGSLTGAPLETVVEVSKSFESSSFEKFRNRAYSEGSQQLGVADAQQQQQQPTVTSRYKTELCRPFEESGRCKYGDKCQFAHGKQELRHLQRHPKYKTELCRTYHTSGLCPYGPRCHFIHNQEVEPSSSAGMQQQQQQQSSPSPFTSALQMHMETQPPTVTRLQAGPRPGNLRILPPLPPAHSQKAVKLAAGGQGFYAASPVASTPPGFEALTAGDSANLLSPISPMTTGSGGAGQFFGVGMIENRQATPPLTQFDVFAAASAASSSHMLDASFSDDGVFDGPPTPPDSDRESNTGSPRSGATAAAVGGQRLPIFRNLSKSD